MAFETERKIIINSTSEIFDVWSYENDFYLEFEESVSKDVHFKLMEENEQLYKDIAVMDVNAIVILPVFTSTAYSENGFYEYYFGNCDDCTTVKILKNNYLHHHQGSQIGARVLETLGYKTITDIDFEKNPNIIEKFDTVILLHNEYVTQSMFNAIINHSHVIYLYPNALYAEIEVDYKNNEITLINNQFNEISTKNNSLKNNINIVIKKNKYLKKSLDNQIKRLVLNIFDQFKYKLNSVERLRQNLGYRETLKRGYVVLRDRKGPLVSSADIPNTVGPISAEFFDGQVLLVDKKKQQVKRNERNLTEQGKLI